MLKSIVGQNERHAQAYNVFGILEIWRQRGIAFEKAVRYEVAVDYYKKFLARARPKDHAEYIPKVKAAIAELGGTL
jgi:hypothetical protein